MPTSLLKMVKRGAFVWGAVALTGFGFALSYAAHPVEAPQAPVRLVSLANSEDKVRSQAVHGATTPALSDRLAQARLIPVKGARPGSYEEVSRVVSREDWNAVSPAQHQLMVQMLHQAQANQALPDACFAPGTPQSVVTAFAHFQNSLRMSGMRANSLTSAPLRVGGRWTKSASNEAISAGQPFTLTWNMVPDGTPEGNNTTGTSDLVAFCNKKYGSVEPMRAFLRVMFGRYQDLTGITFTEVDYDDGAAMVDTQGVLGTRADLRIGGHFIDGPGAGVLAYCYFPNAGDMILDTGDDFFDNGFDANGPYNTLAHEFGHALGLDHTCPSNGTKLMEPFVSSKYRGPQLDDIQAVQYTYGDGNEKGTRNNTVETATALGTLGVGEKTVDEQSINGASEDIDYFSFSPDSVNRTFTIEVKPRGTPYLEGPQNADDSCTAGTEFDPRNKRNLSLQLLSSGGGVLGQSNSAAAGESEKITEFDAPSTGPFVVRVAADDTTAAVQGYTLIITTNIKPPRNPSIDTLYFTPVKPATDSKLRLFYTVSDPDGDVVTTKVAWTKNGKAITVGSNNTIDLSKPGAGDVGDVFKATVTVTDPTGHSATRSISTTIKDNTAPSLPGKPFEVNENKTLKTNVGATDAEGDRLTYALLASPQHGTFTFESSGAFSFVPETNYNGSTAFRVRVTDTSDVSTEGTLVIAVKPVNAPPVAAGDSLSTKEDVPLSIAASTLLKNDVNGERRDETDALNITAVSVPSSFPGTLKLDKAKQTILFTPRTNWFADTSFTYTVTDSGGATDTAKVLLQVEEVDDAPTTSDVRLSTIEATEGQIELSGADIENDTLSFFIKEKPKHGTARIVQDSGKWVLLYKSEVGFHDTDTLTFYARDGHLDSEPATATIMVSPNSAPTIVSLNPHSGTFAAGSTVVFEQKVNDKNGANHLDAIALLISNSKTSPSASKGAALWFDAQNNQFTLTVDDGKNSLSPVNLGQTLENSQVKVKLSPSDVVRSGGGLLLKWHVTFKSNFVGVKSLWSRAEDLAGASVGFTQNGQITIGSPGTTSAGSS